MLESSYLPFRPAEERIDEEPLLEPDTTLFYRAVQSASDLFADHAAFRFSFVAFRRRGGDYAPTNCYGVPVSWRYAAALRLLGAEERRVSGARMLPGIVGAADGTTDFRFAEGVPQPAHRAALSLTDRTYRVGVRGLVVEPLGRGWCLEAAADGRTGRDAHVGGVFTHALTVAFRATKRFGGRELSVAAVVPPAMRGLRSSATAEAFALTNDPGYNPGWGFQNGKVRNARVRRETVPLLFATLSTPLAASTRLTAVLAAEAGVSRTSALAWFDARTPLPDNYRYLPSYDGNADVEAAWRAGDPRYTQIDWDELYAQNRMAAGEAVYALEDRVERRTNLHLRAEFATEFDLRSSIRYGVRLAAERSRLYREVRDLLGASYILDTDYYLIDDETFGNLLQNDLRHPDRRVAVGDRYGYDYALTARSAALFIQYSYRADRFRFDLGGETAAQTFRRQGYFEKEIFPGSASYGHSQRIRIPTYALKAAAGCSFSPRSYLEAVLTAAAEAPDADDLFLQPQYNNRIVDRPDARRRYAAEVNYAYVGRRVELRLSGFFTLATDGIATVRYYDDLAVAYADMAVSGIRTRTMGVEASAEVRLTSAWRLSAAASAGRYEYAGDPLVQVYADAGNRVIDAGSRSAMGGCRIGGAPQFAATIGANWFGRRGWGFRAAANAVAGRYVEPSPLRRTPRVSRAAASPEDFAAFTAQERLDDALTLDVAAVKSFAWGGRRLTLTLMVRNLLDDRNIVYGGYESLRVRRRSSGNTYIYTPFDSRCTYAAPRSFYFGASYKF